MVQLWVTFIDVGWGDSILLEVEDTAGHRRFALIDSNDTSNLPSTRIFLKRHLERYADRACLNRVPYPLFDFVLATHAHADHIAGLTGVIREYGTDWLYTPRFEGQKNCAMANLIRSAAKGKRKNARVAGFDLRLMSELNDVRRIPTGGKNLVVVASVNQVLHFRIFDDYGRMVVDTDEKQLTEVVDTDEKQVTERVRLIEDLRDQLSSLWLSHEPTRSEKGRLIADVASIVGHTRVANRHRYLAFPDAFDFGPVSVSVLWPPCPLTGSDRPHDSSNENNNSLVLSVRLLGISMVLTGDCEADNWVKSADGTWPIPLPQEQLKLVQLPHHGARNGLFLGSTGEAPLLDQIVEKNRSDPSVNPLIAVSCHPKPYGHPHPDVKDRLGSLPYPAWITGPPSVRTDSHRDFTVWTDGIGVELLSRPAL
jgi:beta-lactamase superfamily II metal-dependent hydrolase